jgi:hypothetical protein
VGTLGFELLEDAPGGRGFLFLETDDFQRDYERLAGRGVRFIDPPRRESYRTVVVFEGPLRQPLGSGPAPDRAER